MTDSSPDPAALSRRAFLRAATAGVAAVPAASSLASGRRAPLGVALVGLGGLSTYQLAPALTRTKLCRLAGVVTGSKDKAEAWARKYGLGPEHVYGYDDFDRIAEDDTIDIVYVVLPNSMHKEFTVRAAKAKKHVLCEKPMAVSADECREMIAACDAAGTRLAVGYRCQLEPHHVECMRLVRERTLGPIRLIEAGYGFRLRDPEQWRLQKALAGGGALMDVGIYALQAARYLTGEEPARVSALETKTDPVMFAEVDESVVWTMEFPSGVLASCTTTYNVNGYDRFWVGAEKGWFALAPAYGYGGQKGARSDGKPLAFPATDQFAVQMDDFAACILEGKPSRISGEEGLRDLVVIEAIYRSIATGETVELG